VVFISRGVSVTARRRFARLVVALLACMFAPPCLAPVAEAAGGGLTTTVTPSEVALTPGGSAKGTLVITAGANFGRMSDPMVHVSPRPTDGSVTVTMGRDTVMLGPGASVPLSFVVSRAREGSGQDVPVSFVVTSKTSPVQVSVAMLTVKAVASADLVSVKIESNVQTVDENRPGEGALVITNPRESELRITMLEIGAPDGVDVKVTCPTTDEQLTMPGGSFKPLAQCPITVGRLSQAVVPVELAPGDAVVPGPRSLLVKIDASTPNGLTASAVATLPFTVDIFAESDVLKAVGVPVFLLLPGVIIVLTAWFLIRWVSPWRKAAKDLKVGASDVVSVPTFIAILSLAVSLAVAALYPVLTREMKPGYERDYLKAYGFRDFYYVIGYSFLIAVGVWLLACALYYLVAPAARWLWILSEGDEPGSLLRKIGLRGLFGGKAVFPRVTVGGASALDLGKKAKDKTFVAPAIDVTVAPKDALLTTAIEADGTRDAAFPLWRTVDKAVQRHKATLAYRAGDIARPQLVDRSQVVPSGQHIPIAKVPVQ
jgi:hypothetical protein